MRPATEYIADAGIVGSAAFITTIPNDALAYVASGLALLTAGIRLIKEIHSLVGKRKKGGRGD